MRRCPTHRIKLDFGACGRCEAEAEALEDARTFPDDLYDYEERVEASERFHEKHLDRIGGSL